MSDGLEEYLRAKEPGKTARASLWRTAIGLQKVDGLTPSQYFVDTARRDLLLGEDNKLQSRFLLLGGWNSVADSSAQTPTSNEKTPTSNSVTPTSNGTTPTSSPHIPAGGVLRLSKAVQTLLALLDGEMPRAAVMKSIGIRDRKTFLEYYLAPALKLGLVEMTQPDSPRSPTQKYRLTEKGMKTREVLP